MKKSLDKTKPPYSEYILPVPWPFVISRPRPGEEGGWGVTLGISGVGCATGTLEPLTRLD